MKKNLRFYFIISLIVSQSTVLAQYVASEVQYKNYQVTNSFASDSSFLNFLKPYTDSMNKAMGKVIGFATYTLYEKSPESPLGNLLADAMKVMAEKKSGRTLDAAIINSSSIRSYIPKGDVILKHAYEIIPYDNQIVILELKGTILKQLLDHSADKAGWPVSGIRMKIKNRTADSISINNKLLDETATYTIAVADYLANGGDGSTMLKGLPFTNTGYFLRDAIIDYIKQFAKEGKPVTAKIENRVTNAD